MMPGKGVGLSMAAHRDSVHAWVGAEPVGARRSEIMVWE